MTAILGISAFYHDSAAALVVDGRVIAAAQEERFTRKKHDESFPQHAVRYCLQQAGLTTSDLDYVGFYDKPFRKFERLLETYLSYAPVGYRSFRKAMPVWLRQKLYTPRELRRGLPGYQGRFVFTEHHESHAASAFFPSPFQDAAILTLDGVGEWSTSALGHGRDNRIELSHEVRFPHSLGLLYSAFTFYTGFKVNSGEYKLMGLAPYGEPRYRQLILDHLIDLRDDGSFRMDMSYFNYCQGLTMTSGKLHDLFGGPPRQPESDITQREMDLAASIQAVTEDVMMKMARHAKEQTQSDHLVLAGGVALNCVGNGKILKDGPFENVWIQPASGDAGGALGTALFLWHQLLGNERRLQQPDAQAGSLLGPAFTDEQCAEFLKTQSAVFETMDSDQQLCDTVAQLIDAENVVGWFQGRMEFGPRALGARSILGDARSKRMQSVMNLKIKFRESFRPFAPIVLKEKVHEYFQMQADTDSPYMLLVADVHERLHVNPSSEDGSDTPATGLEKLKQTRSQLPAITHVDNSARVQTVDRLRNPLLHQLLSAFDRRTGCPVMINTSFNVRSEPIVCSPLDAWRCFMMTDMDVLVLGHHVLKKTDQPNQMTDEQRQSHLNQFERD
ncbi:MAG: carbamoyltransferase [Planctomycetaceae bacterium]|nr:carbamoyltransferase [Planctomycetaceae bacterium]